MRDLVLAGALISAIGALIYLTGIYLAYRGTAQDRRVRREVYPSQPATLGGDPSPVLPVFVLGAALVVVGTAMHVAGWLL